MRFHASEKVHYDAGPNMTPLVDVVMVILIFLMLVGSFGGAEWYLMTHTLMGGEIHHPSPAAKLAIRIRQDGSRYVIAPGQLPVVSSATGGDAMFQTLSDELRTAHQNYAGTMNADDVQIVIYAEKTVPLSSIVSVFAACNDAGFKKVGFGVL